MSNRLLEDGALRLLEDAGVRLLEDTGVIVPDPFALTLTIRDHGHTASIREQQ